MGDEVNDSRYLPYHSMSSHVRVIRRLTSLDDARAAPTCELLG